MDRPSPVPWPSGFVVKNGSKARAVTSGAMPVPGSETQSDRYCPSSTSRWRAAWSSIHLLPVSMVIRPPSGIASRALMHRLSSAFSSWFGSTSAIHRPVMLTVSTVISGPTVRRIRSAMSTTSLATSVGLGSSVCRREKASRRWVRAAARFDAPLGRDDVALEVVDPALRDPRPQKVEAARNAREEIVEVVGEPARQLAHGLHLLRLTQLFLGPPPFRDVDGLGDEGDHLAVPVADRAQG